MKKQINLLILFMSISLLAFSQQSKKPLSHDDILKWNRISETLISDDGQVIVYQTEPWKGDPTLKITTPKAKELLSVTGGKNAKISDKGDFVVFKITTPEAELHALKVRKTKKKDFPLPKLGIFSVSTKKLTVTDNLKNFRLTEKGPALLAYQVESGKEPFALHFQHLGTKVEQRFPAVSKYLFSKDGNALVFVSEGAGNIFEAGIYFVNAENDKLYQIYSGKADFKQIAVNRDASRIAFLVDTNTHKKAEKDYMLFSWNRGAKSAKMILDNQNENIPDNWKISPNGKITFAPKSGRIFFGLAPGRKKRDSTILNEDFPKLDIWTWNEDDMHTEQLNHLKRRMKKTYLSVYDPDSMRMVLLEDNTFSGLSLINKGDGDQLVGWSNKPYALQKMYEGTPAHMDFYLVNLKTGVRKQIIKDCRATPRVSPVGKYLYWYNPMDTTWNIYNLANQKTYSISTAQTIQVADELNDIPNPPHSYGIAGWLKNDAAILIYDRYDIWKVNPESDALPINLTKNGRSTKTRYHLMRFDTEKNKSRISYLQTVESGIDPAKKAILYGHNEISRQDGYYQTSLLQPQSPKTLISGKYKLNIPIKAEKSEIVLFTKENFEMFPNLLVSNMSFKKAKQISEVNPQQKNFLWGTAELVSWTSLDGRKLEGMLFKPDDFDPSKKYPMIVNFYEKNSQGVFKYRIPEPHRSTIDYHYYTSHGYIVFNPDVYYKTGYPGEDAMSCVMPGVTAMIAKGFVDEKHIGAQGHSWGGYQVAYFATHTRLFAAIESGAPVVNMFSAYGGIRWGSGKNRSFQYEHTQSRIGKSIWEAPLRYLENSPLFFVDKVTTPLLIMANDDDGAVPWYQGIEFFVALRRLGKPAWLLNYNEADHWPLTIRDKNDFQIRLAQFFDHYLKGKPMPKWMKEGIPATKKEIELGYELEK